MVYRGTPVTNILKRVDFNSNIRNFLDAFYDYTINEGENVQSIAHDYYNDVDLDWLVYHTNDIIDPYYDVVLDSTQFDAFIKKKYGSIEEAQKNIFVYKTNYRADDGLLSPSGYNSLVGEVKKYYAPVLSSFGIVSYKRSTEDIYVSTNRVISVEFIAAVETTFTDNEIVRNGDTYATVAFANTTTTVLKHISGDWDRESAFSVTGDKSNTTIEIAPGTYKLLQQVIPAVEEVYYSPYTYYEYEMDLNEKKRDIKLVAGFYADDLNTQLTEIMK